MSYTVEARLCHEHTVHSTGSSTASPECVPILPKKTFAILVYSTRKIQQSVLSLCFTLSLESTPCTSSSISYQFLYSWLTYSCTYHIFLWWLTTFLIHNSLTISLPAQNLPVSQILLPIDSLLPSRLPPRTITETISSEHPGFVFF